MKALEVSIDGVIVGVFVPPADKPFVGALRNGPQHSIVANISEWNLPEVCEGQRISFRMIKSPVPAGTEAQIIRGNIA
jgi:hypothetical protein